MYRPPLSSLAPYLYESWYDKIDYAYAYQWFRSHTPVTSGGCSTVRKGNLIGRNLDWTYSESAEFVVHTDGVVGVANAIPGLTDAFVKSGADDEIYKIVPFMLSDGMNKHGLMVSTLVVPTDKGDNSVVRPLGTSAHMMCTLMLPRYMLDHFRTALGAMTYFKDSITLYHPKTLQDQHYDQHFIIADDVHTLCMEFVDGRYDVTNINHKPFVTNFHLTGVEFNADGSVNTPASSKASDNKITPNGSGLERYNLINSYTGSVESLMRELAYTRAYQSSPDPAVPRWDTEFVGNGRTVDTLSEDYDLVQMEAAAAYRTRTRSSGTTWQTVHSAVYDVQEKKLRIYAQENYDTHWEVSVMADQKHVQHLRGDTAKNDAFTGAAGELTVDMEVKTVRMHDGIKVGGYPLVSTVSNQAIDGTKMFLKSPTAPTVADATDMSTKVATTAFVQAAIAQGGGGGGGYNVRTVLTTSGSYTAPVTGWYKITCIGGGGGGGAGRAVREFGTGGGGGGSGGTSIALQRLSKNTAYSYVIGSGGTGGVVSTSDGSNGGNTTFNGASTVTAGGGYGGQSGDVDKASGGLGGSSNCYLPGFTGGSGSAEVDSETDTTRGSGGSGGGHGGGAGSIRAVGGNGTPGTGGGGGGGGGRNKNNFDGGNGGSGAIIIEYYDPSKTS